MHERKVSMKEKEQYEKQQKKHKIQPVLAVALLLSWLLVAFPGIAFGESSHLPLQGGIANEYDYIEYVYLNGTPLRMEGKVVVNISAGRGDTTTTRFTYTLTDPSGQDSLRRSVTYVEMAAQREDHNQVVRTSQIDRITETVQLDGVTFKLEDGRLSKSVIIDKHPVVNYYSGNWEGRKIYSVNGNEGRLTVEISGHTVGYDNNWGRSEKQQMTQILRYSPNQAVAAASGMTAWDGIVDYTTNLSTDRTISYQSNDPTHISFRGGYLISEQGSSSIRTHYDLPLTTNSNNNNTFRNLGSNHWALQTAPRIQRMYVPNYQDVRGYWAESSINLLAGVKAWDEPEGYFGPLQPITRLDFARAFVQSLGVIAPEGPSGMIAYTAGYPNLPLPGEKAVRQTTAQRPSSTRPYDGATGTPRQRTRADAMPFVDITPSITGHDEVRLAYAANIMAGVSATRFDPYGLLTREQAATLIVRGLGLTSLAPSAPFAMTFLDDHHISPWARESIYVAQRLGILTGNNGYFRPQDTMTRAEAATVLMQSISFLQHTLKHDYY
ncbi:S-layer homology domain-containing protein [Heliorestis convoluta]|uniref:SLH domain-containing protein n=1 Tax=Heliorestis convoluta TaxID=356322 RepID=A0A5Q2MYW3_9FIRM|nr:S-layer homology domain-containing protein [Heliorestis convoluta]QGG47181.1 hypothetical protein FTV88_1029 [Heliorestis convoluta]